ncbi:hypothetical protein M569_10389, partial [Genlisea aurea]
MDDEGGLSFDFEGGLDTGPGQITGSLPTGQASAADGQGHSVSSASNIYPSTAPASAGQASDGAGGGGRRSFRQTVCRHWLRSLCMKGDACGFLHQYDKSRMPVCRFFRLYGECREQDCVYKHTNEDIKECNMYKLGFCPNGPDCRYRHAKLPGPPPPVEEVLQRVQQLSSNNYGNLNKYFPNRTTAFSHQSDKSQFPQVQNGANHLTKSGTADSASAHPQSQQAQQPLPQSSQAQIQNAPINQQTQANRVATPLPQGTSRYFVVKSCNRENLELSVQQGVWATQRSNEAKLNEAFESIENVILIFSVNKTRHFQGCAKMASRIGGFIGGGNWKHANGTAHYGRNFAVKWLKLSELSFDKTRHLRNPYNENLPVKISRDCQELEPSVGEQLASLLYLEPDSDLTAVLLAAETKREQEKARGVTVDNGTAEDPDIVPFEDNEEEEEEEDDESEEEDEKGGGNAGGGRGGGMMWPRGAGPPRPFIPGFPGFPYGPPPPLNDGFPMVDPFGMAPRSFGPYAPRFPGDFAVPNPGMMFSGHHPAAAGGFGVTRGGYMGGGGGGFVPAARGGRPPPPPYYQPQQLPPPSQRGISNSRAASDGIEAQKVRGRNEEEYDDNKNNGGGGGGNSYRSEDSESEDEAPRRSRHGEGKKKSRGMNDE